MFYRLKSLVFVWCSGRPARSHGAFVHGVERHGAVGLGVHAVDALLVGGGPCHMGAARGRIPRLCCLVDGGVKRHGVDRGITLGDAENGRLSIFSSIYRCACRRTKKRGLGRTEHAVTCGVPHQNIPRGRVLCFFEAGVEESEQKQAAGGPGRASKCSASAGRLVR